MVDQEPAIKVKDLHKDFVLPHQKRTKLKDYLVHPFSKQTKETQQAVKGVSFEIKKGEFFGIVGRNGSGKSTLLKTLAGVYAPTKGTVGVNGSLVPFIELGVGFNPELTGRDNIYLNGALLGFSRKEMNNMYEDIVEFAELQNHMDQKLKNFSSGMQVRLAFSIAIRANSDILLIDEVLAVGDASFQKKCFDYFSSLKKDKTTVVFVSHDMQLVQRFCDRAALIDNGTLKAVGNSAEISQQYQEVNLDSGARVSHKGARKRTSTIKGSTKLFDYSLSVVGGMGKEVKKINADDPVVLQLALKSHKPITDAFVGLTIYRNDGELLYWRTTEDIDKEVTFKKEQELVVTNKVENIFGENGYYVNIDVKSNDRAREYLSISEAISFEVVGRGKNGWLLHPANTIQIENIGDK